MKHLADRRSRRRRRARTRSARPPFVYEVRDTHLVTVVQERPDKHGAVCLRCIDADKLRAGHRDPRVRLTLHVTVRHPDGTLDPDAVANVQSLTRRVHDEIARGLPPRAALERAMRNPSTASSTMATSPLSATPGTIEDETRAAAIAPQLTGLATTNGLDTITLGAALEMLEREDASALYVVGSSHRADAIRAMRTVVGFFGAQRRLTELTTWELLTEFPRQLATEWLFAHHPDTLEAGVRRQLQATVAAKIVPDGRAERAESRQLLLRQLARALAGASTAEEREAIRTQLARLKQRKLGTKGKRGRRPKVWRPTPLTRDGGGPRWTETCVNVTFRVAAWLRQKRLLSPLVLQPVARWRETLREGWEATTRHAVPGKLGSEREIYSIQELSLMMRHLELADPRLALLLVLAVGYRGEQVARLRRSNLRFDPADEPHGRLVVPGCRRKKGEERLLSSHGRRALDAAMTSGYLRHLEAARAQGLLTDYPLFPGGKLLAGARAFRPETRLGPLASRTLLLMLRAFEAKVGVESRAARGTRGLRRLVSEVANKYSTDPLVQNVFSGTSAAMRESTYRDAKRQHTLLAALEAHEAFERDILEGRDRLGRAGATGRAGRRRMGKDG